MILYTDIQFIHNFNTFFVIRSWYFDMQFWIFAFDHLKCENVKKKIYIIPKIVERDQANYYYY